MEEIKDRKEYVKATQADGMAILEGTATWCSQCKAIAPFVDEVRLKIIRFDHATLLTLADDQKVP